MKQGSNGPVLSAVFVDYDNIYLSLKRKSEEAAKRFSKEAHLWIKEIESGRLITPTNAQFTPAPRRIVMNRCYGNPVPRRNTNDNSTDMTSFPFVRHHFLRAGFEVIDCPPLTAQLKNSSDIRMVMDVRDYLNHDTYFDEFVILSGDADFTPVLHRLRSHARRTVIFANDYTAAPYTAICDGEVRESALFNLLMEGRLPGQAEPVVALSDEASPARIREEIVNAVVGAVKAAGVPVPLEALAERTTRALGHDRTVGTQWAGSGSFLELLRHGLPGDVMLTEQPPYMAYDAKLGAPMLQQAPAITARPQRTEPQLPQPTRAPVRQQIAQEPTRAAPPVRAPQPQQPMAPAATAPRQAPPQPVQQPAYAAEPPRQPVRAPAQAAAPQPSRPADQASQLQQSIARIHDACQAPPLSPPEYRLLFEVMSKEITEGGLQGSQTVQNIANRALEFGVEVRRDDIRFVLEVVSEADPWFEQGASANLFAGRFRNFVVARCRSQGLQLSTDELDLIEAWFAGNGPMPTGKAAAEPQQQPRAAQPQPSRPNWDEPALDYGWAPPQAPRADIGISARDIGGSGDEFPKILRSRGR